MYYRTDNILSAFIEITESCNFKCVHCYLENNETTTSYLDVENIRSIFQFLKEHNCIRVTISGGEPLVHKDFTAIIKMAIDYNFIVDIFTNGSVLTGTNLDFLRKIGVNMLSVSILSAEEENYKKITGKSVNPETIINLLKKSKINYTLKTPVLSYNYKEIPSMYKMFKEQNISYSFDCYQMTTGYYAVKDQSVFCSLEQINWLYTEISKIDPSSFNKNLLIKSRKESENSICYSGACSICIDSAGVVHPCASLRYCKASIKDIGIHRIWEEKKFRSHHNIKHKDLKECENCSESLYCTYCPGKALVSNNSLIKPDKYHCEITKIIHSKYN